MSDPKPSERWACRACGYSPRNRQAWCDLGCGNDYNEMFKIPESVVRQLAKARAEGHAQGCGGLQVSDPKPSERSWRYRFPVQVYWCESTGNWQVAQSTINRPALTAVVEIPAAVVEDERRRRLEHGLSPMPETPEVDDE